MAKTQTAEDHRSARRTASLEIISALKAASSVALGFDGRELQGLVRRLKYCMRHDNQWVVEDAWNSLTGEAFDAEGQFWSCGSKLCPNCLAKQARRSRAKLRAAVNAQSLRRGERYYFATFTIINGSMPLVTARKIVNRAWSLFRKRQLCVDLIRGGSKSEEFTVTAKGIHYHLHCLFLSKFLLFNEVRRVWTECVEKAFNEEGIEFDVKTKDGMLIAKIIRLDEASNAIQEVCKYVTKSDSWSKMRSSDLIDVALVRRWNRMFELFGSFRLANEHEDDLIDESLDDSPIVHTRHLNDGLAVAGQAYWRDRIEHEGIEAYFASLDEEILAARNARIEQLRRRWPGTTIKSFNDEGEAVSIEPWD